MMTIIMVTASIIISILLTLCRALTAGQVLAPALYANTSRQHFMPPIAPMAPEPSTLYHLLLDLLRLSVLLFYLASP